MDGKDLPSSSDESDADFVPKEEEYKSDSGSEESDYESSGGEEKSKKSGKRKKRSKRVGKKAKTHVGEEEDEEEKEESKEEKNIDVDALWADFKKDVNNLETKKTAESSTAKPDAETESSEASNDKNQMKPKPRPLPNFQNRSKAGGLSSVLNKIGKKDKMSTLQKSQLDWNNFKKSEGIEEEIKTYNKGKDGYLDKQDFLQRTDLRQFEIEKELRSARRKF